MRQEPDAFLRGFRFDYHEVCCQLTVSLMLNFKFEKICFALFSYRTLTDSERLSRNTHAILTKNLTFLIQRDAMDSRSSLGIALRNIVYKRGRLQYVER
jgi:hypothetical protein